MIKSKIVGRKNMPKNPIDAIRAVCQNRMKCGASLDNIGKYLDHLITDTWKGQVRMRLAIMALKNDLLCDVCPTCHGTGGGSVSIPSGGGCIVERYRCPACKEGTARTE